MAGQEMAVGARHRFSLKRAFGRQKPASKRVYTSNITILLIKINVICWSDRDWFVIRHFLNALAIELLS